MGSIWSSSLYSLVEICLKMGPLFAVSLRHAKSQDFPEWLLCAQRVCVQWAAKEVSGVGTGAGRRPCAEAGDVPGCTECTRMCQDVPGCARMCRNVLGCTRMCRDALGCAGIAGMCRAPFHSMSRTWCRAAGVSGRFLLLFWPLPSAAWGENFLPFVFCPFAVCSEELSAPKP